MCWLLGIRTPGQLRSHPLRGAIFETWAVSEIRNHRMNRGELGGLSHDHACDAAEADLIISSSTPTT